MTEFADDGPIIGRDTEMRQLTGALASGNPELILLVGGPATGKGRLLRELRTRAPGYRWSLVPAVPADERKPWLTADKQCTISWFSEELAKAGEATAGLKRSGSALVLMYGYHPDEEFGRWFTREFLPRRKKGRKGGQRCMVIVAASAADAEPLRPLADRRVELGPLPREAVIAELLAIDAAIDDKLQGPELEMYADAIIADPSVTHALRHLLPLTSGTQLTGPPDGKD